MVPAPDRPPAPTDWFDAMATRGQLGAPGRWWVPDDRSRIRRRTLRRDPAAPGGCAGRVGRLIGRVRRVVDPGPPAELLERQARVEPTPLVDVLGGVPAQENLPADRQVTRVDPRVQQDGRGAVGGERVVEAGLLPQRVDRPDDAHRPGRSSLKYRGLGELGGLPGMGPSDDRRDLLCGFRAASVVDLAGVCPLRAGGDDRDHRQTPGQVPVRQASRRAHLGRSPGSAPRTCSTGA